MGHYKVCVTRISSSSRIFSVIAENKEEAKKKAFEKAGNYEFSEHNADYEIDQITEVK